jgi:hypothetical protein
VKENQTVATDEEVEAELNALEEKELEDLTALKKHQLRVEMTNKVLKPISKIFITNCFIKRSDDAWWFGIYSRSTFYRLKKEAIKEFLYYFNL